jgi:hypothetical protein
VEIARVAKAPVPTVVVETEAELKTAPVVIVDEKGEEAPLPARTEVAQTEPVAQPAPEPQATTAVSEAPAPAELPDTASSYPMLGLIGLASLAASKVISRFANRA